MLGWTGKLKNIFSSASNFSEGIKSIFYGKKIDQSLLDEFKEILIASDFGVETSKNIINSIKKANISSDNIEIEIKELIQQDIKKTLLEAEKTLELSKDKLNIILFVGVNGSGKTTTIGKLASKYIGEGLKVKIAACDTFRAGAWQQMKVWSDKVGAQIVTPIDNKNDPASIAYRAISESQVDGTNLLFIDSAGRLQNNKNLMDELEKIVRVVKKLHNNAPDYSILVLDGTSGQNTISQCEQFSKVASVNGIIITKLDGTAKSGTIVGITEKFKLPIYFIGTGEKIEDLKTFNANDYTNSLFI